jgi:hypothetical protein
VEGRPRGHRPAPRGGRRLGRADPSRRVMPAPPIGLGVGSHARWRARSASVSSR